VTKAEDVASGQQTAEKKNAELHFNAVQILNSLLMYLEKGYRQRFVLLVGQTAPPLFLLQVGSSSHHLSSCFLAKNIIFLNKKSSHLHHLLVYL
jgi:hypothetical protein